MRRTKLLSVLLSLIFLTACGQKREFEFISPIGDVDIREVRLLDPGTSVMAAPSQVTVPSKPKNEPVSRDGGDFTTSSGFVPSPAPVLTPEPISEPDESSFPPDVSAPLTFETVALGREREFNQPCRRGEAFYGFRCIQKSECESSLPSHKWVENAMNFYSNGKGGYLQVPNQLSRATCEYTGKKEECDGFLLYIRNIYEGRSGSTRFAYQCVASGNFRSGLVYLHPFSQVGCKPTKAGEALRLYPGDPF